MKVWLLGLWGQQGQHLVQTPVTPGSAGGGKGRHLEMAENYALQGLCFDKSNFENNVKESGESLIVSGF